MSLELFFFFLFKQKTAYELRISDWSSDVCSSDLFGLRPLIVHARRHLLVDERLLPVKVLLSKLRARVGRDPFGRDLRGIAALHDGAGLASTDRVADPLQNTGDRATAAPVHAPFAPRCAGSGPMQQHFPTHPAPTHTST